MKNIYKSLLVVLMIFAVMISHQQGYAQDDQKIKIESVVRDSEGNPVANATITTLDGSTQVMSNESGEFTLEVPQDATLVISGNGYKTNQLPAFQALGAVFLEAGTLQRNVALPFGSKKARNTVGSVFSIDPEEIAKTNSGQRLIDILADRIPGLRVNGDNDLEFNIRGLGELIFIVDGVPRNADNINIEEVAEVTVLKDVHASILYGPEAQNGVILIKTKRGQPYKNEVNVFAERGMSVVRRNPSFLNSVDFMTLRNEALLNDGLEPQFSDSLINLHRSGVNPYAFPDVDYYSSEYIRNSQNFNRVVTEFSGGNDNTKYYAHVGWTNSGTLFNLGEGANSSNNRFNVRANTDFAITDFIKGRLDGIFVFNIDDQPAGDFWRDAARIRPFEFSPLVPASAIQNQELLRTAKFINDEFLVGGNSQFTESVYGDMFFGGSVQNVNRTMQFNNGLDFDLNRIVKGLTLSTNLNFDLYNAYEQSINDEYAVYDATWRTTDSIGSVLKIGRDLRRGVQDIDNSTFFRRVGFFANADYNRTFGRHSISSTLIGYYNRFDDEGDVVTAKFAHAGLRVAYTYDNKYLVDFSGTLANSIKLPDGGRTGFSPALGVGWILSEESFLSESSVVDFLKLKVSAGILRTDEGINNYYLYNSTWDGAGNFSWRDGAWTRPARIIQRAANPNLGFQQINNLNIGIEGYLFDNSIGFDANFFTTRVATDLIQRSIYPAYLGDNIPFENFGAETYTGVDLGINYFKEIGEDFSFNVGVNMLVQRGIQSEIDEQVNVEYQRREGRPVDAVFGLEAIGFFADSTDIANSTPQVFSTGFGLRPGDIKYKDQNNDGIIDEEDEVEIGNNTPRMTYGVQLGLNYKNFSLFALGGGQAFSETQFNNNYFWVDGNDKYSDVVNNRWTPESAATATYPRMSSGQNTNNFRSSTFWLQSDNQFNLNHVQLTYTFGNSLLRTLNMERTSIYLRGQNLLTIAQDVDKREIRINNAPMMRHFALGIRAHF